MKNKFLNFFIAFAVILTGGICLTACGDDRITLEIAELPQNVDSCYLTNGDEFGGSVHHSGEKINKGEYKLILAIEQGYGIGSLSVYFNDEKLTLLPSEESEVNRIFKADVTVSENVSIHFEGQVFEITKNIKMTYEKGSLADAELNNVKIAFESIEGVNLPEEPVSISEFSTQWTSVVSNLWVVPIRKNIKFSVYYEGENSYDFGLKAEGELMSDPNSEGDFENSSPLLATPEYNAENNSIKYNFEFDNSSALFTTILLKLDKSSQASFNICDNMTSEEGLVFLSAGNPLYDISVGGHQLNGQYDGDKFPISVFAGEGQTEVVLSFIKSGLGYSQFESMTNNIKFDCGDGDNYKAFEPLIDLQARTITLTIPRPITFSYLPYNPYDININTNLLKNLIDATGTDFVKQVSQQDIDYKDLSDEVTIKVNGEKVEKASSFNPASLTFRSANRDHYIDYVGQYSGNFFISAIATQKYTVTFNIESNLTPATNYEKVILSLSDGSTKEISGIPYSINNYAEGDWVYEYYFDVPVGAEVTEINFVTHSAEV